MTVIIGIDPHKATHTAVAIGCDEAELATVTVRATRRQVDKLLGWATSFERRTWAIESAGGLGYSAGSAARRCRRARPRRAGHPGLEGAGARDGQVGQERPQRRPLGGHCGPPVTGAPVGARRPTTPKYCGCWPNGTRTSGTSGPSWCADSTPCIASLCGRRNRQGTQRF